MGLVLSQRVPECALESTRDQLDVSITQFADHFGGTPSNLDDHSLDESMLAIISE